MKRRIRKHTKKSICNSIHADHGLIQINPSKPLVIFAIRAPKIQCTVSKWKDLSHTTHLSKQSYPKYHKFRIGGRNQFYINPGHERIRNALDIGILLLLRIKFCSRSHSYWRYGVLHICQRTILRSENTVPTFIAHKPVLHPFPSV